MELTSQEIIQRIVVAFDERKLAGSGPIFLTHSCEVDIRALEELARRSSWPNFPNDVLGENSLALTFMTPEAFALFLPAYLVLSVKRYSETDTLTASLITCLTPPDEADAREFEELVEEIRAIDPHLLLEEPSTEALDASDETLQLFMDRAAVLKREEKTAVRDYLEYIHTTYGADFSAYGPKQALDRYWAEAAANVD